MKILVIIFFVLVSIVIALLFGKYMDHRAESFEMTRLINTQPTNPLLFDPSMIAELPEPARRYFEYSITPSTPLNTVAHIKMSGQLSMGSKESPNYSRMESTQVLAPPIGFVWKMKAGTGITRLSGSDTHRWTRFWMGDILPIARYGGNMDHKRSAYGRYVAEAVFWAPASLLPGPGIVWQAVNKNTAQVTVTHDDLIQSVYIKVNAEGAPIEVHFVRWSNANPAKIYRDQPFGGYLSQFQIFQGFRLATHVEAGNHFATDDYFPFFIVDVSSIDFPSSDAE